MTVPHPSVKAELDASGKLAAGDPFYCFYWKTDQRRSLISALIAETESQGLQVLLALPDAQGMIRFSSSRLAAAYPGRFDSPALIDSLAGWVSSTGRQRSGTPTRGSDQPTWRLVVELPSFPLEFPQPDPLQWVEQLAAHPGLAGGQVFALVDWNRLPGEALPDLLSRQAGFALGEGWFARVKGQGGGPTSISSRRLKDAGAGTGPVSERIRWLSSLENKLAELEKSQQAQREERLITEALRDTVKALNSTLNLEEVLDRILQSIGRFVPYEAVAIMMIEGETARAVRSYNHSKPRYAHSLHSVTLDVHNTADLRWMAEHGQSILIQDTLLYDGWVQYPETAWIRSFLGTPIHIKGNLVGFLCLYSSVPGFFRKEYADRLQAFADQAGVALENARLYKEAQQQSAQLQHSNMLISALGRVSARIVQAHDPKLMLDTMGADLQQVNIQSAVVLLNSAGGDHPQLEIHYVSLPEDRLATAEEILGHPLRGYQFQLEDTSHLANLAGTGGGFIEDVPSLFLNAIPFASRERVRRSMETLGAAAGARLVFLPLSTEENLIGFLALWGPEVQEWNIPELAIFANNVAIAMEKARLYAEVQQMAMTDDLTGLYNRRGLFDMGQREVERAVRYQRPLSAIMVDVDHFKELNDNYGHRTGDEIICKAMERCRGLVREMDLVGRYGGDEFVLLLIENNLSQALQVAERLRQQISAAPISMDWGEIDLTISLGVAELDPTVSDLVTLLDHADQALYEAKRLGRNRVEAYQRGE